MPKRLAKSAPLLKWNELTVKIKQLEMELEKEKDEKVREVLTCTCHAAPVPLPQTLHYRHAGMLFRSMCCSIVAHGH